MVSALHHDAGSVFRASRDLLLEHRTDYETALAKFRWPDLPDFNWASEWVDGIAADPTTSNRLALWIVEEDGSEGKFTFSDLSTRSNQVANWLREQGIKRGDRIVVMLGNQVELWEIILASMKLGSVIIPAATLLTPTDLQDRIHRGKARHVIAQSNAVARFDGVSGDYTRIVVGEGATGWTAFEESTTASREFVVDPMTRSTDPMLLYFTSGTTALPKLVEHTHASYPIGHLSTMYWIGLAPGDVHLNVASPGWAKHAWSNVFAPWNAEATVFIYNYSRFDPDRLLKEMARCGVTSFCAPPTVWRLLIQSDLTTMTTPPTKLVSAGEPLNPEVIEKIRAVWGIQIRDGYGQTETTLQIGNTPGQPIKVGSMGRPLPGYPIALVDPITGFAGDEGEICIELKERPLALMTGYKEDAGGNSEAMRDGFYHTGDIASRDTDGYITYIGRSDDVFKSSDYRISPFELESVMIEHESVVEAAVVPCPDPIRLSVPKAYLVLRDGVPADHATARALFQFSRQRLAPFKRIRRIEFAELPKTISGKIRRVELRSREVDLQQSGAARPEFEFREEDFADLI